MSDTKPESNVMKNRWGEEVPYDASKYPEGSPAKEGKLTGPSGQGGATPKSRPDYQDQWPANPPQSEHAKAKAEENDKIDRGEVSRVNPEGTGKEPAKTAAPPKEDKK
jgi:hypothetical protein